MSTPQHPNAFPFDARALTEPVDRAAVRAFSQQQKARGIGGGSAAKVVGIVVIVFVIFFFLVVGVILVNVMSTISSGSQGFGFVPFFPMLLLTVIAAVIGIVLFARRGSRSERQYRLDRFAQANAMSYLPRVARPQLPGMIFTVGDSREATDLVRGTHPRFVEFGNYSYSTGSGDDETTHRWGYVAVQLDTPLPHIVLDALSNNGLFGKSNLPTTFSKNQRLTLEGDFNKHFALYCPEGYERDALYLFTPDIMARFMDHAAVLDVEIVDNWLFLYSRQPFSTTDPATWAWLFSVVGTLLGKLGQWARWRDDKLSHAQAPGMASAAALPFTPPTAALTPPPGVAMPGRRLTRSRRWLIGIPLIIVVAWTLFSFARGFLSL